MTLRRCCSPKIYSDDVIEGVSRPAQEMYWVVLAGRQVGIHVSWAAAHSSITRFSGNVHRKFPTLEEAVAEWKHYCRTNHRFPDGIHCERHQDYQSTPDSTETRTMVGAPATPPSSPQAGVPISASQAPGMIFSPPSRDAVSPAPRSSTSVSASTISIEDTFGNGVVFDVIPPYIRTQTFYYYIQGGNVVYGNRASAQLALQIVIDNDDGPVELSACYDFDRAVNFASHGETDPVFVIPTRPSIVTSMSAAKQALAEAVAANSHYAALTVFPNTEIDEALAMIERVACGSF